MEDSEIIERFWQRDEEAITETADKYGKYLYSISFRILRDEQDAEECVNDTYIGAWQSIPPHRPSNLSAYLGKITRRISVDRVRKKNAEKRRDGKMKAESILALEELEECVSGGDDVQTEAEKLELKRIIDGFLAELPLDERRVFMRRYWYLDSIREISDSTGFSESKIKSMLYRTRNKLRKLLEKEGF